MIYLLVFLFNCDLDKCFHFRMSAKAISALGLEWMNKYLQILRWKSFLWMWTPLGYFWMCYFGDFIGLEFAGIPANWNLLKYVFNKSNLVRHYPAILWHCDLQPILFQGKNSNENGIRWNLVPTDNKNDQCLSLKFKTCDLTRLVLSH